jgi:hypothetical protein
MKTQITDIKKFHATLDKAKKLGSESRLTLLDCLKRLNNIRKINNYTLTMYPDFVKHSWGFTFFKDGKRNFNGGMILHGLQETFSVELDGEAYPHWSLHT